MVDEPAFRLLPLRTAMADAIYRAIRQEYDSFAVEVTRTGALPQTAAGFATEAEAEAWIARDKRFCGAADPFRGPDHGWRLGF